MSPKMFTLAGELPELTDAINALSARLACEGIVVSTADFGGVRTEADTKRILKYRDDDYVVYVRNFQRLYPGKFPTPKEKWRPIAPFGSSHHNFGAARDLKIECKPEGMTEAACYRRMGELAPEYKLKWGGTFKQRIDPPHFELQIALTEARRRWKSV